MKHLVWILVILNGRGGIAQIPQSSHDRCTTQAAWINEKYGGAYIYASAFCAEGS